MLRLLADQNLDHDIPRGLQRRIPPLDFLSAFEIGMSEAPTLNADPGSTRQTHHRHA